MYSVFTIVARVWIYYLFSVAQPAFFVAYYWLALKYHTTAYEMPFLLQGTMPKKDLTCCTKKCSKWVMVTLNILVPMCSQSFFAYFTIAYYAGDLPPERYFYMWCSFCISEFLLLNCSSVMLL